MEVPENLKFTKEHVWLKVDESDSEEESLTAVIGITDEAQHQLKDIVFIELPEIEKKFSEGSPLASIESVKSVSEVISPLDCQIVEVNESLAKNPEVINTDPYEQGWIAKIEISEKSQLNGLLTKEQYDEVK